MAGWSITTANSRNSCPKQMVLAHKIAWHKGKPIKRKAFELKNMVNFDMWQGKIVDRMIEKYVIPNLQKGYYVDYEMVGDKAIRLAKEQYRFSKEYRYRELSKSKAKDSYCVLEVHELFLSYDETDLQKVYDTIRKCIMNIPEIIMPDGEKLVDVLSKKPSTLEANVNGDNSESKLKLRFEFDNGFTFPQIDLIQFFTDSVTIYDWKVSNSYLLDASQQLATYGIVLQDFLNKRNGYKACRKSIDFENIRLIEVNFLRKETKEREFNTNIANQMLDYMYLSNQDITLTIKHKDWTKIDLSQIPTTENSNTCEMCKFQTLCSFLITNNYDYEQTKYVEFLRDTRIRTV